MADDNVTLLCEAKEAVRPTSEAEQVRCFREMKIDIGKVMMVARSLEMAVNQLDERTDITSKCIETLISI